MSRRERLRVGDRVMDWQGNSATVERPEDKDGNVAVRFDWQSPSTPARVVFATELQVLSRR